MDHLRPTPGTKKSDRCSLSLNAIDTDSIYRLAYSNQSLCILINSNAVSYIFGLNDDITIMTTAELAL